jgi:hypothetical protein
MNKIDESRRTRFRRDAISNTKSPIHGLRFFHKNAPDFALCAFGRGLGKFDAAVNILKRNLKINFGEF